MSELVEVEITSQAITAQYGTLSPGDILRTNAKFAEHLVEDCGAAKYTAAGGAKADAVVDPALATASASEEPKAAAPAKSVKAKK